MTPDWIDTIHNRDSRSMDELPDGSVDLMVTSPPYNATKRYDQDLTLAEYFTLIASVLEEVFRVLRPGGIVAFNIANVGRKPYIPMDCHVIQLLVDLGYVVFQEIIWNKAASSGGSCAWGSWQSASNPSLRDVHEYIIMAAKPGRERLAVPFHDINDLPSKLDNRSWHLDARELLSNTWTFQAESAKRVNHPAPFHVELPFRTILLFTSPGDVVLDPFMGSGSVALAALLAGRHYVGYEIDPDYVAAANTRIDRFKMEVKA